VNRHCTRVTVTPYVKNLFDLPGTDKAFVSYGTSRAAANTLVLDRWSDDRLNANFYDSASGLNGRYLTSIADGGHTFDVGWTVGANISKADGVLFPNVNGVTSVEWATSPTTFFLGSVNGTGAFAEAYLRDFKIFRNSNCR
jgi:hypothetical protein